METACWPNAPNADPKFMKFGENKETMQEAFQTLTQRFLQILATPRAKDIVFLPCAGWPTWPTATQAKDWCEGKATPQASKPEMECRVHLHNGCCVGGSEVIVTPPASKPERATEDEKTSLEKPGMECRVHLHNGKEVQQREIDELLTYLVPKDGSPVQEQRMPPELEAPKRSFAQHNRPRAKATGDQNRK